MLSSQLADLSYQVGGVDLGKDRVQPMEAFGLYLGGTGQIQMNECQLMMKLLELTERNREIREGFQEEQYIHGS